MTKIKSIKPIPFLYVKSKKQDTHVKLTATEQGKLWATYMGNSMAVCVLRYMLEHVEDHEIKLVLENALNLAKQFVSTIKEILMSEDYPIPTGFTEADVNPGAGRLFADEFYLHYLKYTGKAGMSIYSVAVTLTSRPDIRDLFIECSNCTMQLINQVIDVSDAKGLTIKPPSIPYPSTVEYIHKQSYLNGFFGKIRPLQALEIAHLYDNIENNAISKAVLIGFSQVAQLEQVRDYFKKGKGIAEKHFGHFSKVLEEENLSTFSLLDPMVTASTDPPFSDKLMMAHKLDMFTMRIRTYGNALSFSARHDVAQKYARYVLDVANYVEDGANILIEHGWIEQPPQAVDRKALVSN